MTMELQPRLENAYVKLEPLAAGDFEALYAVASDPLIWEQHPNKNRYQREAFATYFKGAIESRGAVIARSHWGGRTNRALKTPMLATSTSFIRSTEKIGHGRNRRSKLRCRSLLLASLIAMLGAARADAANSTVIYVVRRSWHIDIGFAAADLQAPLASATGAISRQSTTLCRCSCPRCGREAH